MKALSLKQPWLYAMTDLGKIIENRTWKPPQHIIRQWIALHASKRKDPKEWAAIEKIVGRPVTQDVPVGCVVAVAYVVGYSHIHHEPPDPDWEQLKWFFGPWGWILNPVVKLPFPMSCKGALSLWDLPEEIEKAAWNVIAERPHIAASVSYYERYRYDSPRPDPPYYQHQLELKFGERNDRN